MSDHITKQIEIRAPLSRVWMALSDSQAFGKWFQVSFDGPFVVDQLLSGQLTYPGYEEHTIEITVKKMDPEHLFSFTWHPYALDRSRDYSQEKQTCIEFRLKKIS